MVGHSSNFDWSNQISALLTSSSPILGDIKFKVVDKEDGLETTLAAHKIILALHSDHFQNAFFGSGVKFKEQEEGTVVIKDTTKEAFEDFLAFNYEKNIEFEKKTLKELYEILNLAEKYQVKELKDKMGEFIKNFPLTIDNVVDVAKTTEEFSHFENLSNYLYASCVAFIGAKFTDVQSVLTFVKENEDKMMVMKLLQDVKNPEAVCWNCQQKPCRNKSNITKNDLIEPGMQVLINSKYQRYQNGRVVSKNGGIVTITWSNPADSDVSDYSDSYEIYLVYGSGPVYTSIPRFKYACDK